MGTQLLYVDILESVGFLGKKFCGHKVTKRERRKMQRTAIDVVALVPITILMLIPVTPVGHAAMLAAIRKYIPSLVSSIPRALIYSCSFFFPFDFYAFLRWTRSLLLIRMNGSTL
ncbi:hypothetical protein F511_25913 [Dorcoceras hygrometricum]|uniref:Uncharacterized protein n=1 Tax=Dorcoceras hygrometricum TaxID=472368 RepID=A0A2Z7A490_9LAMI|nr:hypothetical protein F511_25913 [Dorcoceras hygrometricum]